MSVGFGLSLHGFAQGLRESFRDHGILAVGKGRENVAKEMVAAMVDEDSEVISIYYGAETTEEDAESLAAELEEAYPDCEVEVNMGGQPIYYYIISVE